MSVLQYISISKYIPINNTVTNVHRLVKLVEQVVLTSPFYLKQPPSVKGTSTNFSYYVHIYMIKLF